ncbi:unnamed protein product [Ascophyllum nodosum]
MKRTGSAGPRIKKVKGRWTKEEHESFILGVHHLGRDWGAIGRDFVPTRSETQIRTHAQKYFKKLEQGLPFPEEPYESMRKEQSGPPATHAIASLPAAAPSPPVNFNHVAAFDNAEDAASVPTKGYGVAAAASGSYSTPNEFLGIPNEMHDKFLPHLLRGFPVSPVRRSLPSSATSVDQASAVFKSSDFDNWDKLDYGFMEGDYIAPASEEEKWGGSDGLPSTAVNIGRTAAAFATPFAAASTSTSAPGDAPHDWRMSWAGYTA